MGWIYGRQHEIHWDLSVSLPDSGKPFAGDRGIIAFQDEIYGCGSYGDFGGAECDRRKRIPRCAAEAQDSSRLNPRLSCFVHLIQGMGGFTNVTRILGVLV